MASRWKKTLISNVKSRLGPHPNRWQAQTAHTIHIHDLKWYRRAMLSIDSTGCGAILSSYSCRSIAPKLIFNETLPEARSAWRQAIQSCHLLRREARGGSIPVLIYWNRDSISSISSLGSSRLCTRCLSSHSGYEFSRKNSHLNRFGRSLATCCHIVWQNRCRSSRKIKTFE